MITISQFSLFTSAENNKDQPIAKQKKMNSIKWPHCPTSPSESGGDKSWCYDTTQTWRPSAGPLKRHGEPPQCYPPVKVPEHHKALELHAAWSYILMCLAHAESGDGTVGVWKADSTAAANRDHFLLLPSAEQWRHETTVLLCCQKSITYQLWPNFLLSDSFHLHRLRWGESF